jgi:hypothetical protein
MTGCTLRAYPPPPKKKQLEQHRTKALITDGGTGKPQVTFLDLELSEAFLEGKINEISVKYGLCSEVSGTNFTPFVYDAMLGA